MSAMDDEGVLILAPIGRDAALAATVLARASIVSRVCKDVDELCRGIESGAGCALLTEESLSKTAMLALADVLSRQPPWSDFPIILFGAGKFGTLHATESLQPLGNVAILDRPVHLRMLLSAVKAALRGRRRQYQARRAIVQRDQFLAMLGHELRNPLGAILLATELLAHPLDNTGKERQRAIIERQARHLSRLVDDLLEVARVTSGKVVLKREPVDVNGLCSQSVQAIDGQAKARGQALALRLSPHPLTVDGDIVRLEQIMTNLLANAVKYTPQGGKISVEVAQENGEAVIRVCDTGDGIDPSMLETIFELFTQAPATLERSQGGLGVGLTLVRSLVRLHGGSVSASSAGLGHGSAFTVRLPALAQPAPVQPEPAPPPVQKVLRILIIDDNLDLREMLRLVLKNSGYKVETAADGTSGLSRILSEPPDVAIIDVGLPGMDGYQVAQRVRESLGSGLMLIALTGYGQAEDRERARKAGFDIHLTKPVTARTLRNILEQRTSR